MKTVFPDLGFGLGLRPAHYPYIFENQPDIDWFEIISENFMDTDGRPKRNLARIREMYPVVMHGVALSIGTVDPLNSEYVHKLKALCDWLNPAWISDHLCWTGIAHKNSHDLLPVPYTDEALKHIVERIKNVQDFLGRSIALENPSTYLEFKSSHMREAEFIARMVDESGCHLLLDVNNVYVSCYNHRLDPKAYLDTLPLDRVIQVHLSGHTNKGTHIIDTHDAPVIDEVLTLYQYVVQKAGRIPNTMIEWDDAIPEFPVLSAELDKARHAAKTAAQHGALPQLAQQGEHYIANQPAPLHVLQQRMQDAIFRGCDTEDKPDAWIRAKPDFAPDAQLAVYTNGYRWRLYDVVASDYPVLKHYMGQDTYSAMLTDFIETTPSQHFNINRYAGLLTRYLDTHYSDDGMACQMCELETAISQLTDVEETIALTPTHIQGMTPDVLLTMRLYPRKALQLFAFDYPLNDYYIAVKEEQNPRPPAPQASWLAVFRHDDIVWRMALEQDEYLLLKELFTGTPIGEAIEKIGTEIGDIEQLAAKLFHWFSRWQRNGLLSADEWLDNSNKRSAA